MACQEVQQGDEVLQEGMGDEVLQEGMLLQVVVAMQLWRKT